MTTTFRFDKPITVDALFGGRLADAGISENVRILTRGDETLCVEIDGSGTVTTAQTNDAAENIVPEIAKRFATRIFSEDDPEFWGFTSKAEWADAKRKEAEAARAAAAEDQARCRRETLNFLRRRPHNLRPGDYDFVMVAALVHATDPTLLKDEERFWGDVESELTERAMDVQWERELPSVGEEADRLAWAKRGWRPVGAERHVPEPIAD